TSMETTLSSHAASSEEARRRLPTWLVEFERSWDEDLLGVWARKRLPAGDPIRRPALLEMVQIDLRRRWQLGRRIKVEAYLKAIPELGTPDTVPVALLQAEFDARRQAGVPARLSDFARRFPLQAEALRRRIPTAEPSSSLRGPQTP